MYKETRRQGVQDNSLWAPKAMKRLLTLLVGLMLLFSLPAAADDFTVGKGTFLLNGEPFIVKAAELHYPRIPQPYWEQRIQSCKALGMNTICIYVFWNIHEQREGRFDFTGQNDVAAFCRLAQKHGMYVIVRPGPYVCAEWEMGGLPWWLLKKKDIRLREQDPYFMERVRLFEKEVGKQLAPLTIQNGGPIIMVQVENEYGSYGEDKAYISEIRDCLRGIYGDKMTLFQCDWSSNFEKNGLDDLVWTMNFGTGANIDQQFARLKQLRPDAPMMCSEFWSGWFDKWGARHETRPADDMVSGIDEMLSKGISFSLYMTHGGTSFGHWAGANSPGFAPDVTSYDYDAPINEYGWATEKYYKLRKVLQKYSDKPLPPEVKAPAYLISIPKFELKEYAPLILGADSVLMDTPLLTMEEMNMGWGTMVYIASLPEVETPSVLTINEAHDFAQVYVDDKLIGSIDRVQHEKSLALPPVHKGQELKIVVEAMGRINFGRAIKDYKGITERVTLTAEVDGIETMWNLKRWTILTIPDDYQTAVRALNTTEPVAAEGKPGYYRGYFSLKKRGDTFLVMEPFGKGQVYVNGYPIGRFWHIGPQQTLYVPGCWLKRGLNEVVVLDVVGPAAPSDDAEFPTLFAMDHPVLDKLNVKTSVAHNHPADKPEMSAMTPIVSGTFKSGNGWQTVKFESPATGRYVALQALSTHDGKSEVCVAEVYVRGTDGQRLSRESWTVKYADSEDLKWGNYGAEKTFDLQESTYWRTARKSELPHLMVIDLGDVQQLSGFDYLPRAEQGAPGSVKDYKIYVW